MITKVQVDGYIRENVYFYIDEKTKHGFLIDPGAEVQRLIQIIKENDWAIEKILITHGHFDHIGAVNEISKTLNIPVFASEKSKEYFENPQYNMSYVVGENIVIDEANYLDNNSIISLEENSDFYLKMIASPGHTSDSVIYINENEKIAFVGDTIFKGSYGRTDLPGSSEEDMKKSLKMILELDAETQLFPGHSEDTSVKEERKNHPEFDF